MTSLTLIFGLISAVGGLGGIGAIAYIGVTRSKIQAEARKIGIEGEDVVSGRALEMYTLARQEATEAKREARECHQRQDALEEHVNRLEQLLRESGLTPPPFRWPVG